MKKIKITFWIFTCLMALSLGFGAVFNAVSSAESVTYLASLGYPAYIVPFLGIAKLLGIAAILIPGFPRIKEWAYAGLVFDLVGAMYSHVAMGFAPSAWVGILLPLFFVAGSYIFYHKLRKAAGAGHLQDLSLATS